MGDGGRSLSSSIPVHLDKTDEEIEMEHAGDAAAAVAEVEGSD